MTAVRDIPRDEELVASVERLAAIGSCSTPSFSPDASRIAFLSDLSGTPQLWTMPSAGGWTERVTAFADPVTTACWSPTDDLIAVELAPGGGLNQQIYLVDRTAAPHRGKGRQQPAAPLVTRWTHAVRRVQPGRSIELPLVRRRRRER